MPPYADLDGDSGVEWYDVGPDSITVTFRNGSVYRYDYDQPGPAVVDRMRHLADSGRGLSGYIGSVVKDRYAQKLG